LLESADIVTLCSPAVAHQSCRPGGPRLKNRHDARWVAELTEVANYFAFLSGGAPTLTLPRVLGKDGRGPGRGGAKPPVKAGKQGESSSRHVHLTLSSSIKQCRSDTY
jgi:hypothetical protein